MFGIGIHTLVMANALSSFGIPYEVNCFLNRFAEEQKTANKLILVTKDVNGRCGIENIALIFDYHGSLDFPAARQLIVSILTSLLQEVNNQPKLRCCFVTFPLTIENLSVRIRVRSECLFYPFLGNIASIIAADGLIYYGTLNSYTYEVDTLRFESYVQAAKVAAMPNVPDLSVFFP